MQINEDETPAEKVYRLRCDHGLSQSAFADRFGLAVGTVKNIEQGRAPSSAMRLVLAAIEIDAGTVQKATHSITGTTA